MDSPKLIHTKPPPKAETNDRYKTAEFKELQKKWYKQLSDTGFNDIETVRDTVSTHINSLRVELDIERLMYFEECNEYLRTGTFKTATELFIFKLHCRGLSNREISDKLALIGANSMTYEWVRIILSKILAGAGIRPPMLK